MHAYEAFHRQMSALHAPELLELNLTLAQLKAVYLVAATGPIRMSALSVQLGTAISTTSGVVDRLVQAGMLARSEDPADRRQVLVAATPTALQQLEDLSELGRDRMRQLLNRLASVKEIETIESAVRLLGEAATATNEEATA
jgi:DNA-binding MarR family transcriptional regulator